MLLNLLIGTDLSNMKLVVCCHRDLTLGRPRQAASGHQPQPQGGGRSPSQVPKALECDSKGPALPRLVTAAGCDTESARQHNPNECLLKRTTTDNRRHVRYGQAL